MTEQRAELRQLAEAAVKLAIARHGLATEECPDLQPDSMAADEIAADVWNALNGVHTCDEVPAPELMAVLETLDAAARFKNFVHSYLDAHNVPHGDPENPHQREGCRIGARLDLLFAQRDKAEAEAGHALRLLGRRREDW